jgi:DNA-binding transcriptional LysR family regulator
VERGFDAGVRLGESLARDMVAIPLGGPMTVAVVASPAYLRGHPAPLHPDDLLQHNCVRFRFAGTGAIYKWEFRVDGRMVEYEIQGNLTISDSLFSLDAALDGVGLAYTFEPLARPHLQAGRLQQVLQAYAPTFPGFYLYYPSRHDQPTKLKALIAYIQQGAVRS